MSASTLEKVWVIHVLCKAAFKFTLDAGWNCTQYLLWSRLQSRNLSLPLMIGEWDCDVLVYVDIEELECRNKCIAEPYPLDRMNNRIFKAWKNELMLGGNHFHPLSPVLSTKFLPSILAKKLALISHIRKHAAIYDFISHLLKWSRNIGHYGSLRNIRKPSLSLPTGMPWFATLRPYHVGCWVEFHLGPRFTNGFSIAIQIWWKFRFTFTSILIHWSLQFCTWHNSCIVVACAKICCDLVASNGITTRRIFHWIWIASKNR